MNNTDAELMLDNIERIHREASSGRMPITAYCWLTRNNAPLRAYFWAMSHALTGEAQGVHLAFWNRSGRVLGGNSAEPVEMSQADMLEYLTEMADFLVADHKAGLMADYNARCLSIRDMMVARERAKRRRVGA